MYFCFFDDDDDDNKAIFFDIVLICSIMHEAMSKVEVI